MYNNTAAINSYQQNNLGIETPEKLISMLYEGAIRFCGFAKRAIQNGDVEKKVYWINRVINIFVELAASLDVKKGGDIALYLSGLYDQQIKNLIEANANDSIEKIDEVVNVLKELNQAWKEETKLNG